MFNSCCAEDRLFKRASQIIPEKALETASWLGPITQIHKEEFTIAPPYIKQKLYFV